MATTANINVNINTSDGIKNVNQLNNEFKASEKTIKAMREESARLNDELEGVTIGSKRYEELRTALIGVNTELANTELSMEALDNEKFASELKSVTGGLMDMAGGLTLVGVSGEGVEQIAQTFAKVEGASKIATGAIEAYSSGMKLSNSIIAKAAAAHAAMATVQTAEGNASIFAAAKMRILNLVMAANPVMLLVTGVGLLVGAFALLSAEEETAEEKQKALNERQEKSNQLMADYNKKIDERVALEKELNAVTTGGIIDRENEIKLLEAQGASIEQIYNAKREFVLNRLSELQNAEFNSGRAFNAKEKAANLKEVKAAQTELQILSYEYSAAVQKQQDDAAKASADKAKARREEQLRLQKEYNDKLLAFYDAIEADRQAQITDAREKELQDAANHYDELTRLADAAGQSTVTITENYQNRINAINSKYDLDALNNKKLLIAETAIINEQAAMQEELNLATTEAEKVVITKLYNDKLIQLEIDRINIEREVLLSNTKLTEEERQKIIAESDLKIAEAKATSTATQSEDVKKTLEEQLTDYQNYASKVAEIVTQATAYISEMNKRAADQQRVFLNDSYTSSTIALKQQLSDRIISQEEYDAQLAVLDQERAQKELALKRKSFEQQKRLQIVNATIQGIQATLAAYASGAATPIIGIATGPVYAAIAAGFAAMQVGMISSQQFKAARGGVVPGDGPGTVDSVNALLAPGEAVINSNSAAAFMPLLNAINMAGGGAPLTPEISNTSGNQIIKVYTESNQQPIQAYITEQQVTSTQNRVKNIKDRSKLFR